jgi:ribonuclease HI
MEILAAIAGLEALREQCKVMLYSDSQYIVNGMQEGWAKRWQANNWKRGKSGKALNPDLWQRLLDLCDKHQVEFRWLKGHVGTLENERCDKLAVQAAKRTRLAVDTVYEAGNPAT